MSFQDAIRTCLQQKYAAFTGRARRSEYWFFVLFSIIVQIVAAIIDGVLTGGLLGLIAGLGLLVPTLAAAVRRLHDTGRSGWWLLLGLVPVVGGIVLLVFLVSDSTPEPNQHGPSPKLA